MQLDGTIDLEPDDSAIYRFLQEWFRGCNRGVIEFGWTDERTGQLTRFRRFELDDLHAAARFAAETNARPGASVYFRPSTVRADTHYTFDKDVVQIPGCWVDADSEDAIERVLAGSLRPSMQIITGRHPSKRAQFLWRFSGDPLLVGDWSRHLNRQAQTLAGSDPAVVNPSTLLRLPGTIAWPWKAGRIPELTEWQNGGDMFSLAVLQGGLPPVAPAASPSNGSATASASELLNPIQTLIDQARAGPLWHDPVLRLVAMLVSRGVPDAVTLGLADHLRWPNYTVEQTRAELAKMIEGARRKGWGDADDVMDVPQKDAASVFRLFTEDDLAARPPPSWMIADLLAANTFSMLYAAHSSFKSFVALDWALCLATGTPWCGRAVQKCDVVYIAGEGVAGLTLRIQAWKQHHGIDRTGLRVIDQAVNLMDRANTQALIDAIAGAHGFAPKLIIVDTLHRSMPAGDENSARDVGAAVGNAARIQRELGCTLLAVHHAGKDADRGLRGSSGLPGAADTIIRASRVGEDRLILTVEKQKDAEAASEVHLRAQAVTLGTANGSEKPPSSLALVQDDEPLARESRRQLTPTEYRARRYLVDLIAAEGKPLPQGDGWPTPSVIRPILGVPSARWRQECAARQLSAADDRRNRNATFRRVYQSLLDKTAVIGRDDLVWLP